MHAPPRKALDFNSLKTPFLGSWVILKNLTDFCKTVETGMVSCLVPIHHFCIPYVDSVHTAKHTCMCKLFLLIKIICYNNKLLWSWVSCFVTNLFKMHLFNNLKMFFFLAGLEPFLVPSCQQWVLLNFSLCSTLKRCVVNFSPMLITWNCSGWWISSSVYGTQILNSSLCVSVNHICSS